jgi:lysophospholipase L1-like esterase
VYVNLTDVFDQTSDQTFSDDVHLTPEGNRIIAERLFQILKDMFADKESTAPSSGYASGTRPVLR